MKKKVILPLLVLLLIALFPVRVSAQPVISAESAVLVDMASGQVLYQKNKDQKMYPASTTKILTALIAFKRGNLGDMVKVSREACQTEGSAVGLQEDEYIKLEDLLYAVLLSSANEAAMAVAEHIGGSVEGFVGIMNSEAKAMGAVNSNFANPHGLHDPNHYTTAGDLSIIAREAMRNGLFRKYVGTYHHRVVRNLPRPVNGIPQEDFVNLNKLIWPESMYAYKGATGVKTGYTDEARRCLVGSAERDGRQLLTVVMKAELDNTYADTATLLNYGFNNFKQIVLVEPGAPAGMAVVRKGVEEEVGVVTAGKFSYNIPVNSGLAIDKKILLEGPIEAPVKRGQKVGTMAFMMEGREIGSVDLVAAGDVDREPFFRWWYGGVIISLLFLYVRAHARARKRRYMFRKKSWY